MKTHVVTPSQFEQLLSEQDNPNVEEVSSDSTFKTLDVKGMGEFKVSKKDWPRYTPGSVEFVNAKARGTGVVQL